MKIDDYLTLEEVRLILGVTRQRVNQIIKEKRLKKAQLRAGRWWIPKSEVLRFSQLPRTRGRPRRPRTIIVLAPELLISEEPMPLEMPIETEGNSPLADFIEKVYNIEVPVDHASQQLLKEQMQDILDGLSERERKVLELRFGLRDRQTRTLEEVGQAFGVTRERIRQIQVKAMRKLRHPLRRRRLLRLLA